MDSPSRKTNAPPARWLVAATAAALLLVAAFQALQLFAFHLEAGRLPMWDMAAHGWLGARLTLDLQKLDLPGFLYHLNEHNTWPFGFSLLLVPFLALGSLSFSAATAFSTIVFALCPALLLWIGLEMEGGRSAAGLWAGLLGGLLFLASPLPRLLAVLIMRETAGVFFTALAAALYLRAARLGALRAYRLAALGALALFFIKYNYALIWLLAVGVNELCLLGRAELVNLLRWLRSVLWPWRRFSLGRAALAVYLYLLAVIAVAGLGLGNPLYAGLVVGAAVLVFNWFRRRRALTSWWRSVPARYRGWLEALVLPLWFWSLSPAPVHPRGVLTFLRNKPGDLPAFSPESLLFYFRAFPFDYAPAPFLSALILALAASSLLLLRHERYRVLVLLAALGAGLSALHSYKQFRFFATVSPFLVLAACAAATRWIHSFGIPRALAAAVCMAAAVATALLFLAGPVPDDYLATRHPLYSSDPRFAQCLRFISEAAAQHRAVAVVGAFNELSYDLIRWSLHSGPGGADLVVDGPAPGLRPEAAARENLAALRRWVQDRRPEALIAIRLLPASPYFGSEDFRQSHQWKQPLVELLPGVPGWNVVGRRLFADTGVEISVLSLRAAAAEGDTGN